MTSASPSTSLLASAPVGEGPEAVRDKRAHGHGRDRREVRADLAHSSPTVEEQNEQARGDGASRLDGNVEDPSPRRVARGKSPAPVKHVAIQSTDAEAEKRGDHLRRGHREQQSVGDKAEHRVRHADDKEARELAQGVKFQDNALEPRGVIRHTAKASKSTLAETVLRIPVGP